MCSYALRLTGPVEGRISYINTTCSSDVIRRKRSRPTLAHAMVCYLTALSHYLIQCWLIINKVRWYSSEGNFTRDTPATSKYNNVPKISLKSPRGKCNVASTRNLRFIYSVFLVSVTLLFGTCLLNQTKNNREHMAPWWWYTDNR